MAGMDNTQPLRLLIIGCGGIAGCWLHPISRRADVRVVGLCDLDPARAEARNREFGLDAACGSDPATLIDQVRPDAVIDLTVPATHAQIACLALAKGCHVFAEKPMTATMDEARRVIAATNVAGRVHAVMQNRRWLPQIVRLRDALRAGRIGTPTEVHVDYFMGAHFPGFREHMEHPLLIDMAIHHFDMARFITGADPVAVNALEWNPAGSWFQHGASALVCVEMSGGLRLTYRASWCSDGASTPWEAQWRVAGTAGSALWDGASAVTIHGVEPLQAGQYQATARPVEVAPPAPILAHEAHAGCIDDMIAAVREGRPAATRGEDNVLSQAMVHAAIRSADRGGARVAIAEVMGVAAAQQAVQAASAR